MRLRKKERIAKTALAGALTLLLWLLPAQAAADEPGDTTLQAPANLPSQPETAGNALIQPDTTARIKPIGRRDRIPVEAIDGEDDTTPRMTIVDLAGDTIEVAALDSLPQLRNAEIIAAATADSLATDTAAVAATSKKKRDFNPSPTRAVWLSALCPGLGQIYNRKFWKLPIILGGYVGLAYATSWNNGMLKDYTKAYSDAMDNDPNTNSYMDFFPSTTKEEDIDTTWLKKILKSKKDFYRRYRDLCIICMVGAYLVCMIDAYVDASLAHFDIAPDLTLNAAPAIMIEQTGQTPAIGLQCAITF